MKEKGEFHLKNHKNPFSYLYRYNFSALSDNLYLFLVSYRAYAGALCVFDKQLTLGSGVRCWCCAQLSCSFTELSCSAVMKSFRRTDNLPVCFVGFISPSIRSYLDELDPAHLRFSSDFTFPNFIF